MIKIYKIETYRKQKKANTAIQTFFYFLMVLFMIGIMIFGINKISDTKNFLSEQELIETQKEIKKILTFCEDPLNKNGRKTYKIPVDKFNLIVVVREDYTEDGKGYDQDVLTLLNSGHNIILVNYVDENNYNIVGSFFIDINPRDKLKLYSNNEDLNYINLNLDCTIY